MSTIRFNPLTYANKLERAGVKREQAEVFAQLQEEIITNAGNELATKNDVLLIKKDILVVKHDLLQEMKLLEQRLLLRLSGMVVACTGIIVAVMTYLQNRGGL